MGCLNDYIGIRWCGGSASAPSSLYINDLPGLSIKQFNSITDEENGTFLSVWNTVQNRAERRFALDVREAMGAKYRLKSLAQGVNLGREITDVTTTEYANSDHLGFTIELTQEDHQFINSPLQAIHIQSLSWYHAAVPDTGKSYRIEIRDLDTLEVLFQVDDVLGLSSEWVHIEVNETFYKSSLAPSFRLACIIDNAEQYSFVSTVLNPPIQLDGCCNARVMGLVNLNPLEQTSDTYGMTGVFSIVCDWTSLICQNKNLFSRAFWYLCGIEFLTELIYSTTLSKWTTIGMNQMKDLRAEYEVEYQKSLKQVADGMYLDCDCCLDCASPVQIRTASQFY
jgi:hypothetical protein